MKPVFLKFETSDFTQEGNVWVSDVIDLYDNAKFTNYSVTKTGYGVGGRQYTFVGLEKANGDPITIAELDDQENWSSSFETDTGEVVSGRYVDSSGQIDIASFSVISDSQPDDLSLSLWNSDNSDDTYYEDEWIQVVESVAVYEDATTEDVDRYIKLQVETTEDPLPAGFEFLLKIEVGRPIITPLHNLTERMLRVFPQWMDLHKIPERDSEDPEVLKSDSLGGKLLDAAVGERLDFARYETSRLRYDSHLETADLDQIAWLYVVDNFPDTDPIWSITVDGVEPALADSIEDLLECSSDEDVVYISYDQEEILLLSDYTTIMVNGVEVEASVRKHFNAIDEIGAKFDLGRLRLETNERFAQRIRDAAEFPPNSSEDGLKRALRRELDLWRVESATPQSDYDAVLPTVYEILDLMGLPEYFDERGNPTRKFERLAESLATRFPTTWGHFIWGDALWDVGREDGYKSLPERFDDAPEESYDLIPGVGWGDDLRVHDPRKITGAREYTATLHLDGKQETLVTEYPPIRLDFDVTLVGTEDVTEHPDILVAFTLEVTTDEVGSPVYYHSFTMSATYGNESFYPFFSDSQSTTAENITFREKSSNIAYGQEHATPPSNLGVIPVANISNIELIQGKWNGAAYGNVETSDRYGAWFSHDVGEVLEQTSGTTVEFPADTEDTMVVMESRVEASTETVEWRGETVPYSILLNDTSDNSSVTPVEVALPNFITDSAATGFELEVQVTTTDTNDNTAYGGLSSDEKGEELFVEIDDVTLDEANSAWSNGLTTVDFETSTLNFSVAADPTGDYPPEGSRWESWTYSLDTPFEGLVGEDGPLDTSTNEPLSNSLAHIFNNLSRDDFSMPNDADLIPEVIRVSANDDSRVDVWLDVYHVDPAEKDPLPASEGQTLLVESESGGDYSFGPVHLYSRLSTALDPEWKPLVEGGFVATKNTQYYRYVDPAVEELLSGTELVLNEPVRQGAPIHVVDDGNTLLQVGFYDADTLELSTTTTDTIKGGGTARIFLPYENVSGVTVIDEDGVDITDETSTTEGVVTTTEVTDRKKEYTVTYTVNDSFVVDNNHVDGNGDRCAKLIFDDEPDVKYIVTYESANADTSSVIELPLSPNHSKINEGFIYLSDEDYSLSSVRVSVSNHNIVADGRDFIMLVLESVDSYGNPKPDQEFTLSTDYGVLSSNSVTTDEEGFAFVILESAVVDGLHSGTGTVTIDGPGDVDSTVTLNVKQPDSVAAQILLSKSATQIVADDGDSSIMFYGRMLDGDLSVITEQTSVRYRIARTRRSLFDGSHDSEGTVTSSVSGTFIVGPIDSSAVSGHWFMSVEAEVDGKLIGTTTSWFERPVVSRGVENPSFVANYVAPPADVDIRSRPPLVYSAYDEDAPPVQQDILPSYTVPSWYALPDDQRGFVQADNPKGLYGGYKAIPAHLSASVTASWRAADALIDDSGFRDLTGGGLHTVSDGLLASEIPQHVIPTSQYRYMRRLNDQSDVIDVSSLDSLEHSVVIFEITLSEFTWENPSNDYYLIDSWLTGNNSGLSVLIESGTTDLHVDMGNGTASERVTLDIDGIAALNTSGEHTLRIKVDLVDDLVSAYFDGVLIDSGASTLIGPLTLDNDIHVAGDDGDTVFLDGRLHSVLIKDGETSIVDLDYGDKSYVSSPFIDATTRNGLDVAVNGVIVDRSALVFDGGDHLVVTDDDSLDVGAGEDFTWIGVTRPASGDFAFTGSLGLERDNLSVKTVNAQRDIEATVGGESLTLTDVDDYGVLVVSLTRTGTTLRLRVNGDFTTVTAGSSEDLTSANDFSLGTDFVGEMFGWGLHVGDALTDDQIDELSRELGSGRTG